MRYFDYDVVLASYLLTDIGGKPHGASAYNTSIFYSIGGLITGIEKLKNMPGPLLCELGSPRFQSKLPDDVQKRASEILHNNVGALIYRDSITTAVEDGYFLVKAKVTPFGPNGEYVNNLAVAGKLGFGMRSFTEDVPKYSIITKSVTSIVTWDIVSEWRALLPVPKTYWFNTGTEIEHRIELTTENPLWKYVPRKEDIVCVVIASGGERIGSELQLPVTVVDDDDVTHSVGYVNGRVPLDLMGIPRDVGIRYYGTNE
jgi:hypothetical protein